MTAEAWLDLLAGLRTTLLLAGLAWAIGLPLGVVLGYAGSRSTEVRQTLIAGSHVILVTPFLVLLFWAHYPLQVMLGVVIPPFTTAAALLALYVTLCVAAIVARSLVDVIAEFGEMGRALQLHPRIFARRVAFPLAAQRAMKTMFIVAIASIQMTMFSSLIGVEDLFRAAQRVNANVSRPIEVFTAMAVLYLVVCTPLYFLVQRTRRVEA